MRDVAFAFAALLAVSASVRAEVPPAPPAPGAPVAEDRATKDDYALDASGSASTLKVNGEGAFALQITPKNGKKVHPDAPLEVVIADNALFKASKARLTRSDLKEKGSKTPTVTTTLRGSKAGTGTIDVTVSFFLCTDAWCQRMSDKVTLPVTVTE
jgi:hypothetical protein